MSLVHHRPEDAAEVVAALISHHAVRKINFTGSSQVGKVIAQTAALHLKPVTMELGGKCPAIVLAGADLEMASRAVLSHAFLNVCCPSPTESSLEPFANPDLERTNLHVNGASRCGTGHLPRV